jgi:hypothetical protein
LSELATLHPFAPAFVARYVAAVRGDGVPGELLLPSDPVWAEHELARARQGYGRTGGNESGANAVSFGLARVLGAVEPIFYLPGLGFTQLEAKVDRGIGMLLRPPSRLFADAGLETAVARAMPIRVDASGGMMGGAFIPSALTPQFRDLLEQRMERLARRIAEAEMDAPALLGALMQAAAYAAERGYGLYEAVDVFVPDVPESAPPGMRLVIPDRKRLDRALRARLEEASRPPKEPGMLARLFRRGNAPRPREPAADRRWRGMNDVTPPPEPRPAPPDAEREGRP